VPAPDDCSAPAAPTRRRVLAGGAGALGLLAVAPSTLAGCTTGSGPTPPGPGPTPSADEAARRTAATSELALADLATAVPAATSGPSAALTARLAQAAAIHRAHAAALLEGLPAATPSPTTSGRTSPSAVASPRALVTAQAAAATAYQRALLPLSGPTARLLASVAASDAALAAMLRAAGA
jgi:hypothetical protein